MAPTLRGSIFRDFLLLVSCISLIGVLHPRAMAQHSAARPVSPPVHVSPPAIPHAPIYQPPTYQSPVTRMPIRSAPIYSRPITTVPSTGVRARAPYWPPWHPVRPFPPVIVVYGPPIFFNGPFWPYNGCWGMPCDFSFWPWVYTSPTISSPGPTNYVMQANETPVYVYGPERPDLPQLYLKDRTVLNVSDYWVVDGQLHFMMAEQEGMKPAEQVIPFDELDLQKTVDANTQRGFRFILRNAPFEQYVREHPEGPPAGSTPQQN